MLAVAHRGGNALELLRLALDERVDIVECDVHLSRGRLEVRHHKSLGPLPWLWDKWELRPRRRDCLLLPDLLEAVPPGTTMMLDLKGVGRTGVEVARLLRTRPHAPVVVSSRWWRGTRPFAGMPATTVVLSARGRTELALLHRRLRRSPLPDGVCVHLSLLTPELVERLHGGVPLVMSWPVDDDAALAEARRVGVDAVISKDLVLLRSVHAG